METELKLAVDRGETPLTLARLAAAYGPPVADKRLVSTYFDTDNRQLWTAGATLRVRQDGTRRIQTLKMDTRRTSGLFDRPQWEIDVTGDQPQLNATFQDLINSLVGSPLFVQDLAAQFTSDIRRRLWVITRDHGELELACDTGVISDGQRRIQVLELEIERQSGPVRTLFDLAREISATCSVRPGVQSKAERGFGLGAQDSEAVKAEPISLSHDLSVQAAFQMICGACLRHYRLNEERLLADGGAEAVHQCRVALRRLRSALTIFRPLAPDRESRAIRKRLKRAARLFGDARNIDVLIERRGSEAPIAGLVDHRAKTYASLLSELRSPPFQRLQLDLVAWIADGTWASAAATAQVRGQPIKPFATARLRRSRRRVERAGAHFRHLGAKGRHAVRIEAKTLRYGAEFFADLFKDDAEAARRDLFLASLEALQSALGRLNDQTTGEALCERFDIGPVSDRPGKGHLSTKAAAKAYHALMARAVFWDA